MKTFLLLVWLLVLLALLAGCQRTDAIVYNDQPFTCHRSHAEFRLSQSGGVIIRDIVVVCDE